MTHRNMSARDMPCEASPAETVPRAARKANGSTICVFCGSSKGAKSVYAETARQLGRLIGENGYRLVFGGGAVGLMGEVAHAARSAGAPVIGVLPAFLRNLEPPLKSVEELIVTPDLQQRKAHMLELSDAFVILPGGLGTLDEYFEVITATQLRVHAKPIVVVNVEGYFDPLRDLLDCVVEEGFARIEITSFHQFVATPVEAMDKLECLLIARAT